MNRRSLFALLTIFVASLIVLSGCVKPKDPDPEASMTSGAKRAKDSAVQAKTESLDRINQGNAVLDGK